VYGGWWWPQTSSPRWRRRSIFRSSETHDTLGAHSGRHHGTIAHDASNGCAWRRHKHGISKGLLFRCIAGGRLLGRSLRRWSCRGRSFRARYCGGQTGAALEDQCRQVSEPDAPSLHAPAQGDYCKSDMSTMTPFVLLCARNTPGRCTRGEIDPAVARPRCEDAAACKEPTES